MTQPGIKNFIPRTFLTADEIAAFETRGYHIHEPLFDEAEVAAIREACAMVCDRAAYATDVAPDVVYWQPGDDPLAVRKIDNSWKANDVIRDAVTHPRLGHIAGQLIDAPGIRLWHDQYLYKPERGGKTVTWHQDWAYWQMVAECETVTCWIALCDVTVDMGPMVYLAGSHKRGLQPLPEGISGEEESRPENMDGEEVALTIKAGQVGFHHGLLLHGSGKNLSEIPRVGLVSHTISTACTYKPGQHHFNEDKMKKQPTVPKPGERFSGPQFPMMWTRDR